MGWQTVERRRWRRTLGSIVSSFPAALLLLSWRNFSFVPVQGFASPTRPSIRLREGRAEHAAMAPIWRKLHRTSDSDAGTTTTCTDGPHAVSIDTRPASILLCHNNTRARPDVWKSLVPRLWEHPRGVDVTVHWELGNPTTNESCTDVAEQMLQRISDWSQNHKGWPLQTPTQQREDLASSMRAFQEFGRTQLPWVSSYSARLVASRSVAGTKCPQWHVDHVPCRWIQTLVGPGCQWIENDSDAIRWDRINSLDEEDDIDNVDDRNRLLIDKERATIGQADEGEGVILLGNQWIDSSVRPAVHKSPNGLLPWQGRVLLTMDVHLAATPRIVEGRGLNVPLLDRN